MTQRCLVLVAVLLVGFVARAQLAPDDVVQSESLTQIPSVLGAWEGSDVPLDEELVSATGVDDHLNRYYRSGRSIISLWVAYYRSQRPGHAIHSPMNCLPGSGWQPVKVERLDLGRTAASAQDDTASRMINKVIIEKGGERQLVLYWYQTVDRVTASEYWSKLYLIADGVRTGRTDVALVRVVVPIDSRDRNGEANALKQALPFAAGVLPELHDRLFQA
jgi:EpsI family protein